MSSETPPANQPNPPQDATIQAGTTIGSINPARDAYIGSTIIQQAAPTTPTATHSIPAPIGDFVGRAAEIDALVAELSGAAGSGVAASISGVRGLGGVGKTQLALMVAA